LISKSGITEWSRTVLATPSNLQDVTGNSDDYILPAGETVWRMRITVAPHNLWQYADDDDWLLGRVTPPGPGEFHEFAVHTPLAERGPCAPIAILGPGELCVGEWRMHSRDAAERWRAQRRVKATVNGVIGRMWCAANLRPHANSRGKSETMPLTLSDGSKVLMGRRIFRASVGMCDGCSGRSPLQVDVFRRLRRRRAISAAGPIDVHC
jgi:hypothetical protein